MCMRPHTVTVDYLNYLTSQDAFTLLSDGYERWMDTIDYSGVHLASAQFLECWQEFAIGKSLAYMEEH